MMCHRNEKELIHLLILSISGWSKASCAEPSEGTSSDLGSSLLSISFEFPLFSHTSPRSLPGSLGQCLEVSDRVGAGPAGPAVSAMVLTLTSPLSALALGPAFAQKLTHAKERGVQLGLDVPFHHGVTIVINGKKLLILIITMS